MLRTKKRSRNTPALTFASMFLLMVWERLKVKVWEQKTKKKTLCYRNFWHMAACCIKYFQLHQQKFSCVRLQNNRILLRFLLQPIWEKTKDGRTKHFKEIKYCSLRTKYFQYKFWIFENTWTLSLLPGFDLTLRNAVMTNFATDLFLSNFMLVVKRKFYSKKFSPIIDQEISHDTGNKFLV